MTIASAPLNLLSFPQRWDATARTLHVRFLTLPAGNPVEALTPGSPTFAAAKLRYQPFVIEGLEHSPRVVDAVAIGPPVASDHAGQKAALFGALETAIEIDSGPVPADAHARPLYRKAVVESYAALTGDRYMGDYLTAGDEFDCALHEALGGQPLRPVDLQPHLRWGQIMALALKQPRLATALGLCTEVTALPVDDRLALGGWLYVALDATSDFGALAGVATHYAARIPPLTTSRSLFAAVLVPVDANDLPLDDIDRECERYDDGHARMVHVAQRRGDETTGEVGDAIHLAWDDEQLAEWFNRQVDPATQAPMGTAGFRVDVRLAGTTAWHSLQRLRSVGELTLGAVSLGHYQGEGMVEVVPTQISPQRPGDFWMPRYFATWRGSSLVLSDRDLVQLHRDAEVHPDLPDARLDRDQTFEPINDTDVPLRYGNTYEFRVRLADLSGGGPPDDLPIPDPINGLDETRTTSITFLRHTPPGPVEITHRPTREVPQLTVVRPRLSHPDVLFTSAAPSFSKLKAASVEQSLGLPDPDVTSLSMRVEVRALAGDVVEWHELYTTTIPFPAELAELSIDVQFLDVPTLRKRIAPQVGAPLPLPTARDVRITLAATGREDLGYFASSGARHGTEVPFELHAKTAGETALTASPEVRSFFLRLPPPDGSVPRPTERLAGELDLNHHDLTVASVPNRRTVFACSADLAHILSPERSAITFSSDADVTQRWVNVIQFGIERDWTWRGLSTIAVHRRITQGPHPAGELTPVGTITGPTALANDATTDLTNDPRDEARQSTSVVFFDAVDPKPAAGEFPTELAIEYQLTVSFAGSAGDQSVVLPKIELPVTTPPSQLPRLVSAGVAQSPFGPADDYSCTAPRQSRLWLEFNDPPIDPEDAYFVRVLATAPDPLLIEEEEQGRLVPETTPEPSLPIDSEWIRAIHVGQPSDDNGRRAMTELTMADASGRVLVVPLPAGLADTSPELFSMFTYEIRVGHRKRWCTAQGRFGPPLRLAGVQHPPPPLVCHAARSNEEELIRVSAAFATPVLRGRPLRPLEPKTRLWALLYARVQRSDASTWSNLLLHRMPLDRPRPDIGAAALVDELRPSVLYGTGTFAYDDVHARLRLGGLPPDVPLTALVVETYGEPELELERRDDGFEPVGRHLGHGRTLRVSPLVPVPPAC